MCVLEIYRQSGRHLLTNQIQPIHRRTVLLKQQNALKLGLFFVFCAGAMVEACASLPCLSCIFIILFCAVIYVYLLVLGLSWTCIMPNLLAFIFMTFAMCIFLILLSFIFSTSFNNSAGFSGFGVLLFNCSTC